MTPAAAICALERGKHGKQSRQRALIDAATQVFAEKGYDCATTREVAERSGCSEGLIHRYFGGKRGLLIAIVGSRADELAGESAAGMPLRETLAEDVEQLLLWPLDAFWERRDFLRVCVSQAIIDAEVGRMIGDRLNGARVRFINERLSMHQEAGRIRPDVDVAALALALSGLNFSMGFFGQAVFDIDRPDARRIACETARVITAGMVTGIATAHGQEISA
jgi:AcrR family transcriptional regulator